MNNEEKKKRVLPIVANGLILSVAYYSTYHEFQAFKNGFRMLISDTARSTQTEIRMRQARLECFVTALVVCGLWKIIHVLDIVWTVYHLAIYRVAHEMSYHFIIPLKF